MCIYDHQPTKTHSPICPLLEIRLLQKYIATPHKIAVTPLVDPGFNRGVGGRIFSEILSSEINVTVQTKQVKMGVDLGRGCFLYRNDNMKICK